MPLSAFPALNASLNAAAGLLLFTGWLLIKGGRREAHRWTMIAAFACSALFLVSYLYYHSQVGSVRYQGPHRPFYLAVLLTHTVLAAAVPPLALRSFFLAWKGRFEEHKRLSRWTLPVWGYVSFTGVVVYAMLYRR